jgi:hypothetical protein
MSCKRITLPALICLAAAMIAASQIPPVQLPMQDIKQEAPMWCCYFTQPFPFAQVAQIWINGLVVN